MLYDELYAKIFSKDINSLKTIEDANLLPIHCSFYQLSFDAQSFFKNNSSKKATYNIYNFADNYLHELIFKCDDNNFIITYILFLGQNFMIFGNIQDLIKPMLEQIGTINLDPDNWRYKLKNSPELKSKCPQFSKLISAYKKLFKKDGDFQLGRYTLFSFPGNSTIYLCYNDIIDIYDTFAEIRAEAKRLIALSDKIATEISSAGILDSTKAKKIKNLCGFLRFCLLLN